MFEVFLPAVVQRHLITADSVLFIAKPEFGLLFYKVIIVGCIYWKVFEPSEG